MITIAFVQCSDNKFKVANGQVGVITTKTKVQELDKIFENDSIVKNLSEGEKGDGNYMQDEDEYLIYEKGGKHLLTITPKQVLDSASTIKSIQIFDDRYKTEKGLNINSTFRDINASKQISENNIETSISSVTIFLDDLNATISLDKEDLGIDNYGISQKVTPEQIPDLAKVKSFIVWFN